ncbi:FadR/GntR family transcriptional regulator [Kribbella soli]|uniref:FadR family transcriptional regulator n=1 Tax=Kribbella soli TaxID=1124743 RepID=A0A4R0GYW4_9ACTN|nr:FadR/GntR family transcriptional regulator [Kribbella soli]TCC02473.1 FadR family transcriptional regulator [Kribbella soli]
MTTNVGLRKGERVPRRSLRLATTVVEDLIDAVVSGRLPVGEALPGEQALCDEFGVSRIVIREALQSLQQRGLVIIRQGHGTVVAPATQWNPMDDDVLDARIRHDDSLTVLTDLVHVRVALESELAAVAASRRTDEQAAGLQPLIEELGEAVDDPGRYLDLDLKFHDAVLALSGNDIGRAIAASFHGHARSSSRYSGSTPTTEQLRHAQTGHSAIAAAIEAGDPEAARAAMRTHILSAWHIKTHSTH